MLMAFSWGHAVTGQPIKYNYGPEESYVNQDLAEQLRPNHIQRLRVGQKQSARVLLAPRCSLHHAFSTHMLGEVCWTICTILCR